MRIDGVIGSGFLALVCAAAIYGQSNGQEKMASPTSLAVTIALSNHRIAYEQGDEVAISIFVKNTDSMSVWIWKPDIIQRTAVSEIYRGGERVRSQYEWTGPFAPDTVVLMPGETKDFAVELSRLFPFPLETGRYIVDVTLLFNEAFQSTAGTVQFDVTPMPPEEERAYKEYLRAIGGGEYTDVAAMCGRYLAEYPNSKFADDIALEYGFTLAKLGLLDSAITIFNITAGSTNAFQWQKREASWRVAWAYHDKGDLMAAADLMRQIGGRQADHYANQWEKESKEQNK